MTINTKIIDMPESVSEMVTPNEDDSCTIFLNARHTVESQRKAYLHALDHIRNGDLEREADVDRLEYTAHGL